MSTTEPDDRRVFVIDGERCPLPDVASFTMGERRVLYELAGVVQEDFLRDDDEDDDEYDERITGLTRHPGFMETLMHVAYQRQHPELKRDKVQAVIDRTEFRDAVAEWQEDLEEEEPEEGHPTVPSTSEPRALSPTGSDESRPSFGDASTITTGGPDSNLARTGAIGSGM